MWTYYYTRASWDVVRPVPDVIGAAATIAFVTLAITAIREPPEVSMIILSFLMCPTDLHTVDVSGIGYRDGTKRQIQGACLLRSHLRRGSSREVPPVPLHPPSNNAKNKINTQY